MNQEEDFHDGERIRSLLEKRKMSSFEFGREMDIGKRIYKLLEEPYWTADMLSKAGEVLDIDLLAAYTEKPEKRKSSPPPIFGMFVLFDDKINLGELGDLSEWVNRVKNSMKPLE